MIKVPLNPLSPPVLAAAAWEFGDFSIRDITTMEQFKQLPPQTKTYCLEEAGARLRAQLAWFVGIEISYDTDKAELKLRAPEIQFENLQHLLKTMGQKFTHEFVPGGGK